MSTINSTFVVVVHEETTQKYSELKFFRLNNSQTKLK